MMPSAVQLRAAFGGRDPHQETRNMHQELLEQERRGRLMRDAQIQENCTFAAHARARFVSAEQGGLALSDWIEFGRMHFVDVIFTCGSVRLSQDGEPPLGDDLTNFDPVLNLAVPCAAMVLGYRRDAKGFISGAKLLFFAIGGVPDGFVGQVDCLFTGPAIRADIAS